ncbi:MAG: hypothetical protein HY525_04315 [Betaproteobacteria bacterium]|nr:hypothetical protein [Betaproteobacteria bacterium]
MLVTEQFEKLARTIMKSQDVDESIAILIKGNPECISDDELMKTADRVLDEAAERLTGVRVD